MISRWMAMLLLLFLVNTLPFGIFMSEQKSRLPEVERLIEQEEYEQAVILLNQVTGNGPVIDVETDYYYSVCYNRLGMPTAAAGYADLFLKHRNDDKGVYEKAVAGYGMGNYEEALTLFKQIETVFEKKTEFCSYYGNVHYYTGDYETAMLWLEQAAQDSSEGEILNYLLYDCYYQTASYEQAIRRADIELDGLDPEDEAYSYDREELLYYRGDFYYLNRQYEEAIKDYQVLADEETYYKDEAYYLIARCYAGLEDDANTYKYLKMGVEYDSYYYEHYREDEAFLKFFESDYYQGQRESFEPDFETGLEPGTDMEF